MYSRFRAAASFLFATLLIVLAGCGAAPSGSSSAKSPKAVINLDDSQNYPGFPILFSGLGSSDPQNQFLSYSWNFGDSTTGSGSQILKGYAQAGVYTVTLTVTNQSGLSNSTSISLRIVLPGQVPTANAGGPYRGTSGVPITFNGSGSSDPQGQTLTYAWNFGDGGTATGVAPTHSYSGPGGFTVTLTVTDTSGLSASATSSTSIAYPSPSIVINGPYTGRPTLPVYFTSKVTEPYDSGFATAWSFGDGTTSGVASPSHTYAAPGVYTVTLTASGQYGESATVTSTVTITAQSSTGPALTGVVQSGTAAVSGAHVYLFAANTTGYGQASASLLSGTGLADANGGYVLSSGSGAFTLPAGYACSTHSQLYIYATGGAVGSNTNANTGLLSALGACGYLGSSTAIMVNEATTVAAAFAMSGYAIDPAHVSSPNTTAALTGIGNAFLNAANLASIATGQTLATTPSSNGTAPQATVNTLASILNACVSGPAGSSACTRLFANAQSTGATGNAPVDTAAAAINIAHNQGANVSALYALLPTIRAFTPVLTAAPHDWAMAVTYSGLTGYGTVGLAVDGSGGVWILQYPRIYQSYPYLVELTSNGFLQGGLDTTCLNGTESIPDSIAIDASNNIWLLTTSGATYIDINDNEQSYYTSQLCTVSNAGVMLSPPGGYNLGGNQNQSLSLYSMAIDRNGNGLVPAGTLLERSLNGTALNGAGYILGNAPYSLAAAADAAGNTWVSSPATNGIVKLSSTGTLVSPPNGYTGAGLLLPGVVALDSSSNVWAINTQQGYPNAGFSLSKLSSTGAPLAGPIANSAMSSPYSLAIDGGGDVWVANGIGLNALNSVVELAPDGSLSTYIAHTNEQREYLNGPQSIAVDSSGSVWVSNGLAYNVTQFVGASVPVVTPLAASLIAPYSAPASRP